MNRPKNYYFVIYCFIIVERNIHETALCDPSTDQNREDVGLFYTLFQDPRKDENDFFSYVSIAPFDESHVSPQRCTTV